MGLVDIYAKKYAAAVPVQEKAADGEAAAEQTVELTDEQIDQALGSMTEEQLSDLAKEVAADVKASSAKVEEKKEAAPAPKAEEKKASAVEKFATLLEKELKGVVTEEAKEAAPAKVEEKAAEEPSDEEKLAEEYFAAGKIFAQGALSVWNGKVEAK